MGIEPSISLDILAVTSMVALEISETFLKEHISED